jgi:hypothetical protein
LRRQTEHWCAGESRRKEPAAAPTGIPAGLWVVGAAISLIPAGETPMSEAAKPKLSRKTAPKPKAGEPDNRDPVAGGGDVGPPATASRSLAVTAASKTARVIALLQRQEGVTLDELVAETGWQPHTTRAALTGLRKKGHVITSDKVDDVRRYHAAATK